MQQLKGRILVKGKRLNKLEAAFNNNTEEVDSVSEEDEAAEAKQGEQEAKPKVRKPAYYRHDLGNRSITRIGS